MTNAVLPYNLDAPHTENEGEIFEENFRSVTSGKDISFPKLRTAMVESGVVTITFEVDFKKLNTKISYYKLNAENR